jgi:hypothetical protein
LEETNDKTSPDLMEKPAKRWGFRFCFQDRIVNMLEQLLSEIRQGCPLTTMILARRLNTSYEMVNALLERLVQFGSIQNIEPPYENASCQGSSLIGLSKELSTTGSQLWTLL